MVFVFLYFLCLLGVVLSFHRAINPGVNEKKKLYSEMAQISHNAVTPVRLETDKNVGPDKDPNCLAF